MAFLNKNLIIVLNAIVFLLSTALFYNAVALADYYNNDIAGFIGLVIASIVLISSLLTIIFVHKKY